ncbi:YfcC family protein [Vibrio aestuarianus]|uniref:YfcC family protein n=1 Tax=Vibrio aestuarianus TaxID=28171 RepID=UPI00237CA741|nr:YfcC family protein [Vibrio aestuarianus]MDE1211839.1 YfcC family protein [Vibrio aestuarianus]MDE1319825.1 YfcC family protein [Vibrio aestuarianus]
MTSVALPRLRFKTFPSAFTILFIITLLAVACTWMIPAGAYSKLTYSAESGMLSMATPSGDVATFAATQEQLDKLGVNIKIDQFTGGIIRKPIAVPGTYERVAPVHKGIGDVTKSMVEGTIEGADVIVFILVLGGMIGVVNATGAFNSGLIALSKKSKGREFGLVFSVCLVMALGGTTCGLEEEAVAFYPILVPIFLSLGYDSIVCVGAIFMAGSMGTTFSTINPFSVVIASNAAGIPFTEGIEFRVFGLIVGFAVLSAYMYWYCKKVKADPSFSYTYADHEEFEARYMSDVDMNHELPFTTRRKLILTLFTLAFPLMIWGVSVGGWWFPTMAASFLAITIVIMIISGLSEKTLVDSFTKGASELVGVSLIIGLARGVNLVLEQGMISDTILFAASDFVSGMEGGVFIVAQMLVFALLGFIVPSSSGLAVLSMPIMAPLADTVGIPREIVVSAYNWGQYAMLYLTPTGLVLATLQMLGMSYNKWLKFVWPMVVFVLGFGALMLVIQVAMA